MPRKIEISYKTIVFTVLFILFITFLYYIKDIILQLFVALLIMAVLNPIVTKLEKYKIPRAASVLIVYLILVVFLIFAVATLVPALVDQTAKFSNAIPRIMAELNIPIEVVDQITTQLTSQLSSLPSQILRIGVSVFSNIVSLLAVFIFALYFLLARKKFKDQVRTIASEDQAERFDGLLARLEKELGGWARAQVILMVIIGITTYVGLSAIGVPYALPLAVLAGILEVIPNLGPFFASVPAVLVGLGISPFTGLSVAALYVLVQQLENYLIVPKVMQKNAHVSPVVTLLSIVVGFRMAGVVGAILSVPIVIIVRVLLNEFWYKKTS